MFLAKAESDMPEKYCGRERPAAVAVGGTLPQSPKL